MLGGAAIMTCRARVGWTARLRAGALSGDAQSAVYKQVLGVDTRVAEEEVGGVGDLRHRHEASDGGTRYMGVVGHVTPPRTVAHHPRVDRVDSVGCDLHCQGLHQPGDA